VRSVTTLTAKKVFNIFILQSDDGAIGLHLDDRPARSRPRQRLKKSG
jgi:hypothetical protein